MFEYDWCISQLDRVRNEVVRARTGVRRELAAKVDTNVCSDRILTCRIKSICSPAKGGTGCYRFNYQPGS